MMMKKAAAAVAESRSCALPCPFKVRVDGADTAWVALSDAVVARPAVRRDAIAAVVAAAVVASFTVLMGSQAVVERPPAPVGSAVPVSSLENLDAAFRRVPLAFAATGRGLVAHGPGSAIAFTHRGAAIALLGRPAGAGLLLRLDLVGGRRGVTPVGDGVEHARLATFRGTIRTVRRTAFRQVVYRDVWPGEDMTFAGDGRALRYSVSLAPGASVSKIDMAYRGVQAATVDRSGNLHLAVVGGTLIDRRPVAYQSEGGRRVDVPVRYVLHDSSGGFGFALGSHDPRLPITIDPTLVYSAYLGGSSIDSLDSATSGPDGSAYVTGITYSKDFPTTPGSFEPGPEVAADAFVARFDPTGSRLIYSTLLGGSASETGTQVAASSNGSAYVVGYTESADFPTTPGVWQPHRNGLSQDAFATKLSPDGSRLDYSTYIGTGVDDYGNAVAIGPDGDAYVGGRTGHVFPTAGGGSGCPVGPQGDAAWVVRLDANADAPVYSTCIGGSGDQENEVRAITTDAQGDAYVGGNTSDSSFPTTAGAYQPAYAGGSEDIFVQKLDPTGATLYSTLLGGSGMDEVWAMAGLPDGSVYLTGRTDSTAFPTTAGAFQQTQGGDMDAFATRLSPAGTSLISSTMIGGAGSDNGWGIATDQADDAFVVGETMSANFPTTPDAASSTLVGRDDGYITEVDPSGSLLYSSYLDAAPPGWRLAISVDPAGVVFEAKNTTTQPSGSPGAYASAHRRGQDGAVSATAFRCTITGTSGNDVLIGTSHRDVICGGAGNDRIDGRGGNDIIVGGTGADVLIGGAGADVLIGGRGDDIVYAGGGNDLVRAGDGHDKVQGGDGQDRLVGSAGNDRLEGGDGSDWLWGGLGADLLWGNGGADHLIGSDQNDVLRGGDGADYLNGGAGHNWCPDRHGRNVRENCPT